MKQNLRQTRNNRTKRILFTTSTMPSSDTDPVPAFVKDEAIWLNKTYGYKVDILAPHNAYSKTKSYQKHPHYAEHRFHYFWPYRFEKLTGRGIQPALQKNKLLYFQLPFLFLRSFTALHAYCKRARPDVIYAHWFTPQAIAAALVSKLMGIPFVFDTQASDVIVLKKVPFSKKLVVWVCSRAVAYTAPSEQTAAKLLYFTNKSNRALIKRKLHIIPMGTSTTLPSDKALVEVVDRYALRKKRVILFMGRLVDRKGVDILLKAYKNIVNMHNNTILIIAGDGQERTNLERLARELNLEESVVFSGYATGDKKLALLQAADILTVPSVNVGDQAEGLPIVFMEGISFEKVTVISDATGAHEVVKDSLNSFVCKAGSVKDLTDKLNEALSLKGKKKAVFKKSVRKLSANFQWENVVRRRHDALQIGTINTSR